MSLGGPPTKPRLIGASLFLLALVALFYGTLEYLWQGYVSPPPADLPGGNGASLPMMLGLALSVFLGPGWVGALVGWPLGRSGQALAVVGTGVLPTAVVVLDRLSQTRHWSWMGTEIGGTTHALRLLGTAGVLALFAAVVAVALLQALSRRRSSMSHLESGRVRVALAVLTAVAPLLFWSLRPLPPQRVNSAAAPSESPDVLLLTIDTLRQDALGAYGGPRSATLDSLIATGERFDGWSTSSWTRPAMASFFSGIAPTGTGVSADHAMRGDLRSFVQVFQEAGYVTAAVAANPHLRSRFGFDRGFGYFEHADHVEWLGPVVRSFWGIWLQRQLVDRRETDRGDRVVERTRDWLRRHRPTDRPWLLWVHFMDPHLPYHLRGPEGELAPPEEPSWLAALGPEFQDGFFRDLPAVREGRALTSPAARLALRRLYQREVLFADRQVGELLRSLREASSGRPLLWVVASDHGEEFWDDGGYEHGHTLHESVIRVPLAIGGVPAIPSGSFGGPLRLSDVGPTLLGLVGLGGFDPALGADIDSMDADLRAHIVGMDRSKDLEPRAPTSCLTPTLLAEGMFYGPPRTRLLDASGRDLERNDETRQIRVALRCSNDAENLSPLSDVERAWLLELDLWRARSVSRSKQVLDDPELDRQLRALGYMQ